MAAGVYLLIGALWILFSDRLVLLVFDDVIVQARVQTWKGWVFVAVTATALYALL